MSKYPKHYSTHFSIEMEIGPFDVAYRVDYFLYDGSMKTRRFSKMDCALNWLQFHFSLFSHEQFRKAKEYKITQAIDVNNGHNVPEKKVKYEKE